MTPFRLVSVALLLAVSGLIAAVRAGDLIYTFHYEQVLGTSFELKVVAPSAAIAARAEAAAMDEIARNARILSSYDPDSEFSRWFRPAASRRGSLPSSSTCSRSSIAGGCSRPARSTRPPRP